MRTQAIVLSTHLSGVLLARMSMYILARSLFALYGHS